MPFLLAWLTLNRVTCPRHEEHTRAGWGVTSGKAPKLKEISPSFWGWEESIPGGRDRAERPGAPPQPASAHSASPAHPRHGVRWSLAWSRAGRRSLGYATPRLAARGFRVGGWSAHMDSPVLPDAGHGAGRAHLPYGVAVAAFRRRVAPPAARKSPGRCVAPPHRHP